MGRWHFCWWLVLDWGTGRESCAFHSGKLPAIHLPWFSVGGDHKGLARNRSLVEHALLQNLLPSLLEEDFHISCQDWRSCRASVWSLLFHKVFFISPQTFYWNVFLTISWDCSLFPVLQLQFCNQNQLIFSWFNHDGNFYSFSFCYCIYTQ